ncbi:MAG: VOC family protein [Bacteroidota bacterium]|nr:VOC family protein [Bacteroidota bacterium]MDP4231136.1 VOC family protein [Bacteroidota bacterium]MDP4235555.1 VOC family protein [Bacteroidota bacterium]
MPTINPYLGFDSECEEAFNFYKSAFGGDFKAIMRFKDMPQNNLDPKESNKIAHISLPIGNDNLLMGSDRPASYASISRGDYLSVSVSTDSDDEATRLFNSLSAGGKVTMPLAKAFWGSFFGMFTDKYGVQWMVGHDTAPQR